MMKLKMTFWNQLRMLISVIFITFFISFLFLFYLDIEIDMKFCIYVVLPFFLVFIVPVFIIHLNYYLISRRISYEIRKNQIMVLTENKSIVYNKDEIKEIFFYMTANKMKNSGFANFLFENYYYSKITLFSNEEIIITCLHSQQIDKILSDNFSESKILKIKKMYPIIG